MTDESPDTSARRPHSGPAEGSELPPAAEDPDAALRRLESMGSAPSPPPTDQTPLPPQPAVDPFAAPPASRAQRPLGSSRKAPKATPRPAGSRTSRMVARIAAPVVFLVAVIALVGIVVNSGVLDQSETPVVTPTPKATKTGGGSSGGSTGGGSGGGAVVTKKYVIKSGDTLSSIAVRFDTTTSVLMELNPDLGSTLAIGERITVPAQ